MRSMGSRTGLIYPPPNGTFGYHNVLGSAQNHIRTLLINLVSWNINVISNSFQYTDPSTWWGQWGQVNKGRMWVSIFRCNSKGKSWFGSIFWLSCYLKMCDTMIVQFTVWPYETYQNLQNGPENAGPLHCTLQKIRTSRRKVTWCFFNISHRSFNVRSELVRMKNIKIVRYFRLPRSDTPQIA